MLIRQRFGCKTYSQLKMRHGLWCKKCVKSGEPSFWQTAAGVTSRLIAKNLPLLSAFMFVEQKVSRVWGLGSHGADKQLSKGFCPEQRTKYISKYRQWKFESLKQLLCFFYWILGSSAAKKYVYIPNSTNTQRFQQSGPKRTKKLLDCDLNVWGDLHGEGSLLMLRLSAKEGKRRKAKSCILAKYCLSFFF